MLLQPYLLWALGYSSGSVPHSSVMPCTRVIYSLLSRRVPCHPASCLLHILQFYPSFKDQLKSHIIYEGASLVSSLLPFISLMALYHCHRVYYMNERMQESVPAQCLIQSRDSINGILAKLLLDSLAPYIYSFTHSIKLISISTSIYCVNLEGTGTSVKVIP